MSFGLGVGDFIAVAKIAKRVYKSCRGGPPDYQELCTETKSLRYALESLANDARDRDSILNRKGRQRKSELDNIVPDCGSTLKDLQAIIDKHSNVLSKSRGRVTRTWHAYKVGSCDLDTYRGRLTFLTSTISVFLLSLQGTGYGAYRGQARHDLCSNDARRYFSASSKHGVARVNCSILSQIDTQQEEVFALLKAELLSEEISLARILAYKDDIISYIKALLRSDSIEDPESYGQPLFSLQPQIVPPSPDRTDTIRRSVHFDDEKSEASRSCQEDLAANLDPQIQ